VRHGYGALMAYHKHVVGTQWSDISVYNLVPWPSIIALCQHGTWKPRLKELRAKMYTRREVKTNQSRPQCPTRSSSTNIDASRPQAWTIHIHADVVKVNAHHHASLTAVQVRLLMIHHTVLVLLIIVKLGITAGLSGNIGTLHPILPQAAIQVALYRRKHRKHSSRKGNTSSNYKF